MRRYKEAFGECYLINQVKTDQSVVKLLQELQILQESANNFSTGFDEFYQI